MSEFETGGDVVATAVVVVQCPTSAADDQNAIQDSFMMTVSIRKFELPIDLCFNHEILWFPRRGLSGEG
jgi:hypothetical protein